MKSIYLGLMCAIITCVYISSCTLIFKNVFGFKTIKEIDIVEYEYFLAESDKKGLNIRRNACDSSCSIQIANNGLSDKYKSLMLQPMQAYFFEHKELKFFVANCLVPPKLPNLNWNYQNKFDHFPPINSVDIDSLNLNLNSFREVIPSDASNYKYLYIVDWSLMSKRQSKLLINQVYYNIEKFGKSDSTMIVLNNIDDFYIKSGVEF